MPNKLEVAHRSIVSGVDIGWQLALRYSVGLVLQNEYEPFITVDWVIIIIIQD
jgi:hypothetical protein